MHSVFNTFKRHLFSLGSFIKLGKNYEVPKTSKSADVTSPLIRSPIICYRFAFYKGAYDSDLRLYTLSGGDRNFAWKWPGGQTGVWRETDVTISCNQPYQVHMLRHNGTFKIIL